MRSLICSLAFIFIISFSYGQLYTIPQNLNNVTNGIVNTNALKGKLILTGFADTAAANTEGKLKNYDGALIKTTSPIIALWYRHLAANKWVQILPAGGGTSGTYSWDIGGNTWANDVDDLTFGSRSQNRILFKTTDATRVILDSAGLGLLSSVSDTTANKVMTFNPSTKAWNYGYWYGGSGGGGGGWGLTGNAGTTAGTNFIGTTDAQSLWINTNGTNRLIVPSGGIASSTASTDSVLVTKTDGVTLGKIAKTTLLAGVTASNGLTMASNNVKLGGTLIENTTISGDNNFLELEDLSNLSAVINDGFIQLTSRDVVNAAQNSVVSICKDSIELQPYNGHLEIDTLLNKTSQNTLMGWTSTAGSNYGDVGYITLGSGISLSSGVLSATGSGMTNPMTTTGDIIYSSDNSGTPARLGAGTATYVLTSNGAAAPSWQAAAGGISGLTTNEFVYGNSATTIASLPVATYPSLTEFALIKGLTSTSSKLNYLTSATGTTGTASTNVVFSTSPTIATPTFTTSAIVNNNTVDGAALMVSDANRSLGGTAQTTAVKILGSATPLNNLLHMDNNSATARAGFTLSNSSSSDWANNHIGLLANGASFASNYYMTNIPSKTSDAGYAYLYAQGTQINGFGILTANADPIWFGTNNSAGAKFLSGTLNLLTSQYIGSLSTAPTALLHIKAGTATASTAPLKLTSGTNLTTAEAGAVEYDDKDLFFTPTGTIRKVIPTIISSRSTGQTAAVASVATQTVGASDASFIVSSNILVTTSSAEAFTTTVAYTDEGNTARTLTLNYSLLAGTIGVNIANANGAVPYQGVPVQIRCKASTTITIATTGTFTGATYNVEGTIQKIQ